MTSSRRRPRIDGPEGVAQLRNRSESGCPPPPPPPSGPFLVAPMSGSQGGGGQTLVLSPPLAIPGPLYGGQALKLRGSPQSSSLSSPLAMRSSVMGTQMTLILGCCRNNYAVVGHRGPLYSAVPRPCRRLPHDSGHRQPSLLESTAFICRAC